MSKDWIENKDGYVVTNGFSNNSSHDREQNDYYATEPKAVRLLLEVEEFDKKKEIWECACGQGHLSNEMISLGYNVYSSDKIDRSFGHVEDFLTSSKTSYNGNIITNPPYKFANEFIVKSLSILEKDSKLALFLPIRYLEGKQRRKIFEKYPPKTIYVSSSRIKCAINGEFNEMKGSAVSYAWFIWQKGFVGNTTLKWFN